MPLYEYECESCGTFESFRPISRASTPCACPSCQAPAERVWSVPRVREMSPASLMAASRNEKSRHAPHVCRKSCGCGKKGRPIRGGNAAHKPLVTPSGNTRHTYGGPRSWVIEHA
jgi:putative FmdB family regulatory protein